jgi:arylsulfatase A-like enzyme
MYWLCIIVLFLCLFFACRENRQIPNIIFIMADDHATQAISAYGSHINDTPNIDRLAQSGMRFDNAFCTNAICAPSRAAILTGKFSHLNGVSDNRARFDSTQQTFPKLLQQNGYETAVIGKWHLKSQPTGFNYWNILPGQGAYYNPDFIEMGERKNYPGYVSDITTDICLDWLERRNSDQPFLLLYHHKAPHRNWMPGPDHLKLFADVNIPEPENLFDNYATRGDAARTQEMTISNHMFKTFDLKLPLDRSDTNDIKYSSSALDRLDALQRAHWDSAYAEENAQFLNEPPQGRERVSFYYQRYIKDYLRCIASIDDNVGRLLNYLDNNGLRENTIIIYTSDQGFFLGEHGWYDKRFMYEEALRMPLIFSYPHEVEAASINTDLVQNIDFAPTILDFAGIEIPEDMQGRSLRPLMHGENPSDWRSAIYYRYTEYPGWHMVHKHYGLRTDRYKLIHFYEQFDKWELYDLIKDPQEMQNRYDDSLYIQIRDSLHIRLDEIKKKYLDTDF